MAIRVPQTEKRCTRCLNVKPTSEFTPRYSRSFTSWCRACQAERKRHHYNHDKAYEQHIYSTYGLSLDEYLNMYHAQDKRCASCKDRLQLHTRTRTVVDHDHKTGKVRGLLCNACNTALGMLKDDQRRIQALSRYLKRFDDRKPAAYAQLTLFVEQNEL